MVGQPPARLSVRRSRPERPFSRRLRGVKLAATAARAARPKAELDAQRSRRLCARCASPTAFRLCHDGSGPCSDEGLHASVASSLARVWLAAAYTAPAFSPTGGGWRRQIHDQHRPHNRGQGAPRGRGLERRNDPMGTATGPAASARSSLAAALREEPAVCEPRLIEYDLPSLLAEAARLAAPTG
jgi:hypothetical protein